MLDKTQRNRNGTFKNGHAKVFGAGNGRKPGVPNRIGQDLKMGILGAAIAHGSNGRGKGGLQGACDWLLRQHPKAFTNLLGKLLPHVVRGEVDVNATSVVTVNVVPVPAGHYVTAEQAARLLPPDDDRVLTLQANRSTDEDQPPGAA